MRSEASTVADYLADLSPDRRETISAVRELVREALPGGYRESMNWGMIAWEVPLERYPDTYNGQPLLVAALASQKHHCSLYLHAVYMDPGLSKRLKDGFEEAGLKLDMGKSCVRFKTADELPDGVLRELVAEVDPDDFIALYESNRRRR